MGNREISVRALQLGEHIDVKGLEREDAFSSVPLAFRTSGGGMAVLFKSGAAVFFDMNPVDEYDLPQRGRAIARKLEVIRSTADTITDLMATRTSHRLEVYIIGLIAFEIGLSLYDHFWK